MLTTTPHAEKKIKLGLGGGHHEAVLLTPAEVEAALQAAGGGE